jgi:RimJ/RimL family protein N-acetyltransferase
MTLPEKFDIRYSESGDLPILQNWFSNPKEREPFPFETDQETEDVLRNWVGFSRFNAGLTGVLEGVPCAMGVLLLMPYRKVAHHCSFYLIVAPEHRRKGIGLSMVRNLIHLAKNRFSLEGLVAEIYDPNPISSLLKKNHFEQFARQENFVKINGQGHARILMEFFFQ